MHDFAEELGDYLERLADLRGRGASEDSVRDSFLTFLRGSFPRIDRAEPILLEKHIPALRVRGGFADALYGDLIFEFKRRLDNASRCEGRNELSRYIANQSHPDRFLGFLTDGEAVEVYALRAERLEKVDQLALKPETADQAKVWLDCYLFHEKNLIPTANDVAFRFGERSPTLWRTLRILEALWQRQHGDPAVQTKFGEWQSLLSIVYGSAVGDESLFLRHTYLALFARVLAFVALERRAPNNGELAGLVNGSTFERMGFDNFVGDDFFTWPPDPRSASETRAVLQALATRLTAAYDLSAIHEDLLKELYQELVDPQTRHELGEFYTPDWLAELTLREAGFPSAQTAGSAPPSLLDPACGSGTFLFTAVRLLRESGARAADLVDFCAQHLAGLDVHPLAVTIAKTNLLLALGNDLRGYSKRFPVPVYMADSLTLVARDDGALAPPEIEVKLDVHDLARRAEKSRPNGLAPAFGIPADLADRPDILHAALQALLDFAKPGLSEADAREGFLRRVRDLGVPGSQDHQWLLNLDLMRWLLAPPATDSVWRFILQNACQPELLARRKMAFVVGNPPWLSYRYIQRADYQQRVRRLVFHHALLGKREAHLFTHMELATLFFAFCADRYLANGGTLAFVMPRSILTGAKQHQSFRERYVASSCLLIDCEQVSPLFNVPACAVIWRKPDSSGAGVSSSDRRASAVPVVRLRGELPSRNASYAEATEAKRLKRSQCRYIPPAALGKSPYFAEAAQGASIVPRCLWFARPPESARAIDRRRPQLETDPAIKRQAKQPWKGIRLSGTVEADFLYATLLSDHMVPFGWRRLSLVVLPLAEQPDGERFLLDARGAVRRGKSGLADWLEKAEKKWTEHRKSHENLLDYLNWREKLTRQHPTGLVKLLYGGSGSHLCACVVDGRDSSSCMLHDLPVRGFVADTTTYWLETGRSGEAYYLCGLLNAPSVDKAIKPYQTKGAFGAQSGKGERHIHRRPFEVLPIPRFSTKDGRHRELAQLSRRCHAKVGKHLSGADRKLLEMPIGRLRTLVRKDLLKAELEDIDRLAADVLKQ